MVNFQLTFKYYLHVRALDYTTVVVMGRVGIPLTGLTTPVGWLSLPRLTCPKSIRNRCVIDVFCGFFVLSRCFLDFSVGVVVFVIRLSRISSFFLLQQLLYQHDRD